MPPKDVDRIANSVDPDQTAPFRSSLIRIYNVSQFYVSQYLEFLWYAAVSMASARFSVSHPLKLLCYSAETQLKLSLSVPYNHAGLPLIIQLKIP